jgi:hypothetical protein
MSKFFLKKITQNYIWKRIFYERLTEPLHLNILSIFVASFGSLRLKIAFDLLIRQQHAYALLNLADQAKSLGYKKATVIEFGVAAGAGLLNIQQIARLITKETGIDFNIYGFDTGEGMPEPQSYKDHPELYQTGDFPMDFSILSTKLYENTKLVIGPLSETIKEFLLNDFNSAPIGFISVDVDYYSSTVDALKLLESKSENFYPRVIFYLDDLEDQSHNSHCGEQAAINEFTNEHPLRPIEKHPFLRSYRIFKNARWIDHIYQCHILDHKTRNSLENNRKQTVLTNPYL